MYQGDSVARWASKLKTNKSIISSFGFSHDEVVDNDDVGNDDQPGNVKELEVDNKKHKTSSDAQTKELLLPIKVREWTQVID